MTTKISTEIDTTLAPVLIKEIEAAIKRFNMYPAGHPAARSAAELPFKTLKKILQSNPHVIVSTIEGKIAVNSHPLDDYSGKIVVLETLNNLNLHSVSFSNDLSLDDFETFLKYFIGKMGGKIEWNSLQDYLTENQITGISLDELRYELVGKDQTVIDKGAVGSAGGQNVSISSLLGENPELVLGLLAEKKSAKSGLSEKYSYAVDFKKLKRGIEDEVRELTDAEVMGIIVSGLKDQISTAEDYDEVDMQEILCNISEILERRNQAEMIPKVKKLVSELHLIDNHYIDLILDKKYSRKRLAFEELEKAKEKLESPMADSKTLGMVAKRLEIYADENYTKEYVKTLIDRAESEEGSEKFVCSNLGEIINGAVENESESTLNELYNQIKEKLTKFDLSEKTFTYYLGELEKLIEWLSNEENVEKFANLLDVVSVYASKDLVTSPDKREAVKDFLDRTGTNELAGKLMKQLEKQFESLNRITFNVFKKLQTQAVTLKLCEYLSYPDRALRLFAIRILSEFEWSSPRAFELILSDQNLQKRPEGQIMLPDENWYKLRNIILICGNIGSQECIELIKGFLNDPDPRIAEEMILALEKIKDEKACVMLSSYLYFNDSKVRLRAAVALSNIGDDSFLKDMVEAFYKEKVNRAQMLPLIARLGGEKSLSFFRNLLFNQKESLLKSFFGKGGDELKLQIISVLTKIQSMKTIKLIDEYKASQSSGLGSLFKSNKVMVALENAKRSIRTNLAE